jgi:hypothetical protein
MEKENKESEKQIKKNSNNKKEINKRSIINFTTRKTYGKNLILDRASRRVCSFKWCGSRASPRSEAIRVLRKIIRFTQNFVCVIDYHQMVVYTWDHPYILTGCVA